MKKRFLLIGTVMALAVTFSNVSAQYYVSPQIGFKLYGLNGATTINEAGQLSSGKTTDAGGAAFTVGAGLGYELRFPTPIYRLDLEANLSWSAINFFENGYDNINGSGSFAAAGLSGGGAEVFSLDLMPIHRFIIPHFILSPFAGVGLSLNLFDNTSTTIAASNGTAGGSISGATNFQLGLIIFYGAYFNVLPNIKPFIEFKHLVPFSSTYQLTSTYSESGVGSESFVDTIQDAPGYFNMSAGVQFNF